MANKDEVCENKIEERRRFEIETRGMASDGKECRRSTMELKLTVKSVSEILTINPRALRGSASFVIDVEMSPNRDLGR